MYLRLSCFVPRVLSGYVFPAVAVARETRFSFLWCLWWFTCVCRCVWLGGGVRALVRASLLLRERGGVHAGACACVRVCVRVCMARYG